MSNTAQIQPGEPKPKNRRWVIFLTLGLTVLFIWSNSVFPQDVSRESSEMVKRILERIFGSESAFAQFLLAYVRKIAHFLEYGLLGAQAAAAVTLYRGLNPQGLWNCLTGGLIVAAADESIQILSGRGAMVQDILLDFCGFITAALIFLFIYGVVRKIRKYPEKEAEQSA